MPGKDVFSSLRIKLFLAFFGLASVFTLAMSYDLYLHMQSNHVNDRRNALLSFLAVAALKIDGDALLVPGVVETDMPKQYQELRQMLREIARTDADIDRVYLLRTAGEQNKPVLVFEARPFSKPQPEAVNETSDYAGMKLASVVSSPLVVPLRQGDWLGGMAGVAPVRDRSGAITGLLGVDIRGDTIIAEIRHFGFQVAILAAAGSILILAASFWLTAKFTKRLTRINRAIDEIAAGKADVALAVDGRDEVAALAYQINRLAAALRDERIETLLAAIKALVTALEAKDPYTYGHSAEVSEIAVSIARNMGLSEEEVFKINFAALLHDIGKIGIPDQVLNKQAQLTDEEWQMVKQHPSVGARIISSIPSLFDVAEMVRHHHARWDGKGYPEPLQGNNIPLGARIIAVADTFQAMVSHRPYRKGLAPAVALAEIRRCAGTQFDPAVVRAFERTAGGPVLPGGAEKSHSFFMRSS